MDSTAVGLVGLYLATRRSGPGADQLKVPWVDIGSAWARHTGRCLSANAFRQLTGEAIEQAFPDPCVRLSVLAQLRVWHGIEEQVQQVEKWVLAAHPRQGERDALCSTPSIGRILSLTITLETGDIARFAHVGDYVMT